MRRSCHWEIFRRNGIELLHDDFCELLWILIGRTFFRILLNFSFRYRVSEIIRYNFILRKMYVYLIIMGTGSYNLIITERGNEERFIFSSNLKNFFNNKGTGLTRKWSMEKKKVARLIYHLTIYECYLLEWIDNRLSSSAYIIVL